MFLISFCILTILFIIDKILFHPKKLCIFLFFIDILNFTFISLSFKFLFVFLILLKITNLNILL